MTRRVLRGDGAVENFKHLSKPPKESDLELEGKSGGEVGWSVYSTFCQDFGSDEKTEVDRKIRNLMIQAKQKELLKKKSDAE